MPQRTNSEILTKKSRGALPKYDCVTKDTTEGDVKLRRSVYRSFKKIMKSKDGKAFTKLRLVDSGEITFKEHDKIINHAWDIRPVPI